MHSSQQEEERRRRTHLFSLRIIPGSYTYHFFLYPIVQNIFTWPYLALREVGKYSLFFLASYVPRHNLGVLTKSATIANTKYISMSESIDEASIVYQENIYHDHQNDFVFVLNLLLSEIYLLNLQSLP